MKYTYLIVYCVILLLCSTSFGADLNQYGHINVHDSRLKAQFYLRDGRFLLDADGYIFEGTSLYRAACGYVTILTLEDNVPAVIRVYDAQGTLVCENTYRKIINLKLSSNDRFAIFYDGSAILVLDTHDASVQTFPGSTIFAVDNKGNPISYNESHKEICFQSSAFHIKETPREILLWNQYPVIVTSHKVYYYNNNSLLEIFSSDNVLFEVKAIGGKLYIVERASEGKCFIFTLFEFTPDFSMSTIDEVVFDRVSSKSHEVIIAPLQYGSISNPFPIGNSYGEIQQYGYSPYLHPGVDFLGDDYENVYAVHSGFIKAILTTGGDAYWRIGVANENTVGESEGYLYAHLNQNSIPYTVGDSISTGDFVGTLYPWGVSDFTHIHFARIKSSGAVWDGNWWTTDNPLPDMLNVLDTIPPVFENAVNNDQFAFRTPSGTYLDPDQLMGEIDIIAKCHDIINSSWRVDVWDLRFELYPADQPGTVLYELFSFAFDMPLDTYFSGSWDNLVLHTIYSRDATCYSIGDYTNREYYHIITHSDGDSIISVNDQYEHLDTSQFDDGEYILKVIARDCAMNETSASMNITFDNVSVDNSHIEHGIVQTCRPNPYHRMYQSEVEFIFYGFEPGNISDFKIYNSRGQLVFEHTIEKTIDDKIEITWDGRDEHEIPVSSGLYFSVLTDNDVILSHKKFIIIR